MVDNMLFSFSKICAALAVCATVFAPSAGANAAVRGSPEAEQFVQAEAQEILAVLANRDQSDAQKSRLFHEAVTRVVDVPKITNFVLGKYARTITATQKDQFSSVFRAYAESVYESRLGDYRGQKLRVTGSVQNRPGDVVVGTIIYGGGLSQAVPVSWRVQGAGSAWKIIDVQFRGVWLAITQQQDFVSTLDNSGGDLGVLMSQLQRDAQRRVHRKL